MDLKEFIKEAVKDIVEAVSELQVDLAANGAIVNPPTNGINSDSYEPNSGFQTLRRVQTIEFDTAVTVSSETSAGAKVGLRIWVSEASGEGRHGRTSEEVSRIRFNVPVALPPSREESENRVINEERSRKLNSMTKSRGSYP